MNRAMHFVCIGSYRRFATRAARVFTGCIMKRPDHHQAYMYRAVLFDRMGRSADALSDYDSAVRLQPNDPVAWYQRGNTQGKLGQRDKAVIGAHMSGKARNRTDIRGNVEARDFG